MSVAEENERKSAVASGGEVGFGDEWRIMDGFEWKRPLCVEM